MNNYEILKRDYPFFSLGNFFLLMLITFFYFALGRFGQLLALPPGYVSAVWPPSGIALAAVILFGYRVLPGVFFGSFINNFLLFLSQTSSTYIYICFISSLAIGLGATMQAYLGGYLTKKYTASKPLDTAQNVFKFLIICILSSLVNSSVGSLSLDLAKDINLKETWWTWWIGDSAGSLIYAPLLLSWIRKPWHRLTFWRYFEGALIFILIYFLLERIYAREQYDLLYTLIPLVVWAGFRFYQKGVTLAILYISILVIWHTIQTHGIFFGATSFNSSLLLMELFFGILISLGLLITAALEERKQAHLFLEKKVRDRTKELVQQLEEVKRMQQNLVRHEKLASLGTLTAGVAHEIKNPLNFIANFADLNFALIDEFNSPLDQLKNGEEKEELKEHLKNLKQNTLKILEHARKVNMTVQGMLLHARKNTGQFEKTNLNELVQEYLKLSYHSRRQKNSNFNVKITTNLDSNLNLISINKLDISRVILNLIENAFDSIEEKIGRLGTNFQPEITIYTNDFGEQIKITIKDNGIGISPEIRDKIFTPFFTNKKAGTGLGLSLSHDIIVKEHGGQIEFDSIEDEYAIFYIILPK